jgi:hypothetical protein
MPSPNVCMRAQLYHSPPTIHYEGYLCFVRSSLTNLRCPGSSCGRGLGEVGQLVYSNPPLTRSPPISSKWALCAVTTAWVGVFGGILILFVLDAPGYSQGMLSQFIPRTFYSLFSKEYIGWFGSLCLYCGHPAQCWDMEVSRSVYSPETCSDNSHNRMW